MGALPPLEDLEDARVDETVLGPGVLADDPCEIGRKVTCGSVADG